MWEATSALILGLWESLFYVWKSNSPALSVPQDKTAKKKKKPEAKPPMQFCNFTVNLCMYVFVRYGPIVSAICAPFYKNQLTVWKPLVTFSSSKMTVSQK